MSFSFNTSKSKHDTKILQLVVQVQDGKLYQHFQVQELLRTSESHGHSKIFKVPVRVVPEIFPKY